jgi:hypothetical protein
VEKPMTQPQLPKTDSIQELAQFWDTHDVAEFDDQLREVTEPVFERPAKLAIHLRDSEAKILHQLAHDSGVGAEELVQKWVMEKIHAS